MVVSFLGRWLARHWRWLVFASVWICGLAYFYGKGLSGMDGRCANVASAVQPAHCRIEVIVASVGFVGCILGIAVLFADGARTWWREASTSKTRKWLSIAGLVVFAAVIFRLMAGADNDIFWFDAPVTHVDSACLRRALGETFPSGQPSGGKEFFVPITACGKRAGALGAHFEMKRNGASPTTLNAEVYPDEEQCRPQADEIVRKGFAVYFASCDPGSAGPVTATCSRIVFGRGLQTCGTLTIPTSAATDGGQ